jgi:histidine ammonia-lyase
MRALTSTIALIDALILAVYHVLTQNPTAGVRVRPWLEDQQFADNTSRVADDSYRIRAFPKQHGMRRAFLAGVSSPIHAQRSAVFEPIEIRAHEIVGVREVLPKGTDGASRTWAYRCTDWLTRVGGPG